MAVGFDDADLDRLEIDPHFTAGLSNALVKAYRKKMQAIRAAVDERDLYSQRSLNLEKLKGKRKGQYSLRLNDQYRLVVRLEAGNPSHESKRIVIVGIEDHHQCLERGSRWITGDQLKFFRLANSSRTS